LRAEAASSRCDRNSVTAETLTKGFSAERPALIRSIKGATVFERGLSRAFLGHDVAHPAPYRSLPQAAKTTVIFWIIPSSHVFRTEREGPMTPKAFHALFGRIGARTKMQFPIHPHMLRHGCGYGGPRHTGATGLARSQEHPAYGPLHRAGAGSVQGLLEIGRPG
jgi:hypothetical protein